MEHGLLWFPLLIAFSWLAWQGSQEYQKVEAYRIWAEQFERAKYDIYAVLGQKENYLTWGKPTPKGPINLATFSLLDVQEIKLLVDGTIVSIETVPTKGRSINLEFIFAESANAVRVPFTEIPLAAQWAKYLQGRITKFAWSIDLSTKKCRDVALLRLHCYVSTATSLLLRLYCYVFTATSLLLRLYCYVSTKVLDNAYLISGDA